MQYGQMSDSDLLALLLKDDQAAFNAIYDRHWERLFTISFSRIKQQQTAEDVVQEVFVSLWENRFRSAIQKLENYLAVATMRTTLKYLDRQRRISLVASDQLPELVTELSINDLMDNKDLLRLIEDETTKLPSQCQIIYRKSREQQMTVAEIAKDMNLSPHTVTNQLTKALSILRKVLKTIYSVLPTTFLLFFL